MKGKGSTTKDTKVHKGNLGNLHPITFKLSEMGPPNRRGDGGRYRIRTYDFHRVRMALYR
jgi:hypothetical protein